MSSQENPRLWRFLAVATLRSELSWTRWRRNRSRARLERRLRRAVRRSTLMVELSRLARDKVERLEQQLWPQLEVPAPRLELPLQAEAPAPAEQDLFQEPGQVWQVPAGAMPVPVFPLTPGLQVPPEPVPTAEEQLAAELGWSHTPTWRPSSES